MSYFFSEDWNDWNKFEIWLVSVSELWIALLARQHRRYLFVAFECWMQFVNKLRPFHILLFSLFCFALSFTWSLLPDSLLLCFCTRFVCFCQFPGFASISNNVYPFQGNSFLCPLPKCSPELPAGSSLCQVGHPFVSRTKWVKTGEALEFLPQAKIIRSLE